MNTVLRSNILVLTVLTSLLFTSCQREESLENGGENGNPSSCNNTSMMLKRVQATFNPEDYIDAEWNSNGTIKMLKMHTFLSEDRNATYLYENNRIKEAVIRNNFDDSIIDTVVFRYTSDGKVDSMYMKNDDWFNRKLTYTNGKLTKITRYTGATDVMYYFDIETDAKGNVTKAVEWWNGQNGFEKTSTYVFTRDDRKNPLTNIAPYMLYLDEEYNIFWHWGPNNYINQVYTDHEGSNITLTTGNKYKYNNNCYPSSSQNTINGQVLFADDDFVYTYY